MKRIIAIISMVAILASCDGEGSLKQQVVSDGLSVSEKEIEFYPGGETVEVMLTAGMDWNVTKCPNWITIKQEGKAISGGEAGSYVLELIADCNVEQDYSNDVIQFSYDSYVQKISVSQKKAYLQIKNLRSDYFLNSIDENSESFLWMESEDVANYVQPMTLEIEGNVWWKILQGDSNFKISLTEGEGDAEVTVIPKSPNLSTQPYNFNLSIVTPHSTFNRNLLITQDNLTFEFNHKEITVNELGEPHDDNIDLNNLTLKSEVPWTRTEKGVTDNTAWEWSDLSNDGQYDSENPKAIELGPLKIAANENRQKITHQIEFTPDMDDVDFSNIKDVFSIMVTQDPFVFNIDGDTEAYHSFENADSLDKPHTVTVNASADWTVVDCPDWIQILDDTDSGQGGPGGEPDSLTMAPLGQNLDHQDDREGIVELKNEKVGLSTVLNVSQRKFEFKANQDDFLTFPTLFQDQFNSFAMTVDGAWIVEEAPDWLLFEVEPGSASASDTLYVQAASTNTEEQDLTGRFKVVSKRHKDIGENVSFTVDVKQDRFRFEVTPSTYDTPWLPTRETKSLVITSTTQWRVTKIENCMVSQEKGEEIDTVYVTTDVNNTGSERDCMVVFYNEDVNKGEGKKIEVAFKQKKYDFAVKWPSELSLDTIPALPTTKTYTAQVNCSGDWEVTSNNPDVASVEKNDNNTGFTITLQDNLDTLSTPTAKISVYNEDLDKTDTLKIIQAPYSYEVSSTDPEFGPLEAGKDNRKKVATYECSGKITFFDDQDWIHVDQDNGSIYVYVEKHTGADERSGSVTIHNADNVGDPVEIKVTQKEYVFSINPAATTYTGILANGGTKTIELTSSGAWNVTESDTVMFSVTPTSGTGNEMVEKITVTVNKHEGIEGREGKVTFVSKDDSNRRHEVTFKQNAAEPKE